MQFIDSKLDLQLRFSYLKVTFLKYQILSKKHVELIGGMYFKVNTIYLIYENDLILEASGLGQPYLKLVHKLDKRIIWYHR